MSSGPWSPIEKEANRWRRESSEEFNRRTLDKIAAAHAHRNFLRDITNLNIIEAKYPDKPQFDIESDVIKIPCPFCKSTKYLVESFIHSKILVCDRPNCTYKRAIRNRDKIVRESEVA